MILHKNISCTPLEQLITSVFLISRTLLSGIAEENLRADLPIKKAPGRDDIHFLSARKVKRVSNPLCTVLIIHFLSARKVKQVSNPFCTVLMCLTRKAVCKNRRKKKGFRIFRRIFQYRAGLTDATALSGSDAVFYI